MKKVLSGALIGALVLTGCGKTSTSSGLKTFHTYELQSREVENFNYLTANGSVTLQVTQQLIEGLVEYNPEGELVGAQAKDGWKVNDDSSVWTFTLRDGLKWLKQDGSEYADVTADDFVEGIKYNLDYDNASPNVEMITSFVKGAEEYYEASEAGTATDELFDETVGVKAVDDKTIEYTLVGSKPYFGSVLNYTAYNPLNEKFLDEVGDSFGTSPDTILYNGPYLISEFDQNAYKEFTKNDKYWDKGNVSFDTVTCNMLESQAKAYEMYNAGELDWVQLTQDEILTEQANGNDTLVDSGPGGMVYQIYFNHAQEGNDDWNKAADNINFRKAWFYGIDATEYNKRTNPINPDSLTATTITYPNLVYTSDGTAYGDLDELKEYRSGIHDASKAAEYKAKAMEELKAEGVTFPLQVSLAYNVGNQTAEETFQIEKSSFEAALGTDFIEIVGVPYIRSASSEVYTPNLHSIVISGWGADYADPYNFLYQLTSFGDAYMNNKYSHFDDEELNTRVDEANKLIDTDERYHAFASIEAYILDNAYTVPFSTSGHQIQMTKVNNYSKGKTYSGYSGKMKYWQTQDKAYTTKEYEEFAKED